jgi:hypothetical protein
MIIRYADGTTVEAILVSRNGNTMRVVMRGSDDVAEFTGWNGTWVAEDCEPVTIEFEWQRQALSQPVTEDDCVCPRELASRLIHLLFSGRNDEERGMHPHAGHLPEQRAQRIV